MKPVTRRLRYSYAECIWTKVHRKKLFFWGKGLKQRRNRDGWNILNSFVSQTVSSREISFYRKTHQLRVNKYCKSIDAEKNICCEWKILQILVQGADLHEVSGILYKMILTEQMKMSEDSKVL